MSEPRVFDQYLGRLDSVDGKQVGIAGVTDAYIPTGTDTTVDAIVGEVTGGTYARATFDAVWDDLTLFVAEADEWPSLDLEGIADPLTGIVTYNAEPGDPDEDKLISYIPFVEQEEIDGWLFQPINGFARATSGALITARLTALEATSPDPTDEADEGDVWTVQVPGDRPVWAPIPAAETGGGGAVGSVTIDKTGETPGTISVDLTAVADDVASVIIAAPDGGASTLNVSLPAGTDRAPLMVVAYADDGSLQTLSFPSSPGALVAGPAALPAAVVASTAVMTPLQLATLGSNVYRAQQIVDVELASFPTIQVLEEYRNEGEAVYRLQGTMLPVGPGFTPPLVPLIVQATVEHDTTTGDPTGFLAQVAYQPGTDGSYGYIFSRFNPDTFSGSDVPARVGWEPTGDDRDAVPRSVHQAALDRITTLEAQAGDFESRISALEP